MKETKPTKVCDLATGFELFVCTNAAGGRTYISSEVGQVVLDTALCSVSDVIAALNAELQTQDKERIEARRSSEEIPS